MNRERVKEAIVYFSYVINGKSGHAKDFDEHITTLVKFADRIITEECDCPLQNKEPIFYDCTLAKFAGQMNVPLYKAMEFGKYFKALGEWYFVSGGIDDKPQQPKAEEEPYSDTHNDCHLDNVDKMEDNLKEEPQQPKLPEKLYLHIVLTEDNAEKDILFRDKINEILDYLKRKEQ